MEKRESDYTFMNTTNENSRRNRELYENYASKSKRISKQEIHGKTYVGSKNKELLKNTVYALIFVAAMAGITSGFTAEERVSTYDRVLKTKMEQELNKDQIAAYHNDQARTNSISNWLDKNGEIKAAKKELNPDDYNFQETRITDSDIKYLPVGGDDLFALTQKDQDAIHLAADKVIEEYKGRFK